MSEQFFAEENMNVAYKRDGYITTSLCNSEMLYQLQELYKNFDQNIDSPFYCSNWNAVPEVRIKENLCICNILSTELKKLMPDYEMLYSSFITKKFHLSEKIHPHVDWQFVEEPNQIAFNVWMPFVKTNRINGGLWVVPGSHKWTNEKRGPNIEIQISTEMLKDKKDIPLRAGEAIIYDTRLIHGSFANRWPFKRIALANIMVPCNKIIIHHYKNPTNKQINSFKVDSDFYIAHCNFHRSNDKWEMSEILNTGIYAHL